MVDLFGKNSLVNYSNKIMGLFIKKKATNSKVLITHKFMLKINTESNE